MLGNPYDSAHIINILIYIYIRKISKSEQEC